MGAPVARRSNFGSLQPGSLPSRLMAFFTENPDEELRIRDVCAKFDVTEGAARKALNRLKAIGRIEVVHVARLKTKGRPS